MECFRRVGNYNPLRFLNCRTPSTGTNLHCSTRCSKNDRFSNRPFGVKHFQTIHHHCSVDVAHGLVLLFGTGTTALPLWDSRTRWNNLLRGLAVRLTAGPSGHANSPHPSSREGHHSTARWSSSFLLSDVILHGFHAATALLPGPPELGAVNPDNGMDRPRSNRVNGNAAEAADSRKGAHHD